MAGRGLASVSSAAGTSPRLPGVRRAGSARLLHVLFGDARFLTWSRWPSRTPVRGPDGLGAARRAPTLQVSLEGLRCPSFPPRFPPPLLSLSSLWFCSLLSACWVPDARGVRLSCACTGGSDSPVQLPLDPSTVPVQAGQQPLSRNGVSCPRGPACGGEGPNSEPVRRQGLRFLGGRGSQGPQHRLLSGRRRLG